MKRRVSTVERKHGFRGRIASWAKWSSELQCPNLKWVGTPNHGVTFMWTRNCLRQPQSQHYSSRLRNFASASLTLRWPYRRPIFIVESTGLIQSQNDHLKKNVLESGTWQFVIRHNLQYVSLILFCWGTWGFPHNRKQPCIKRYRHRSPTRSHLFDTQ